MKVAITLTLLFSLVMLVGAFNDFTSRSMHSHFSFSAGNAMVDMNGVYPQPDRILQTDEADCPICGRVGVPFLPYALPIPNFFPDFTCGSANTNEYFRNYLSNELILPKCAIHQDLYEEVCCDMPESLSLHECEENVLSGLFESNYKTTVIPRVGRQDRVSVDTLLKVYAVSEIDITDSVMDIFVEIILTWNDPRLAWNFTSNNCATSTIVRASLDAELTEIWVPSLDLQNRKEGVQSLPDAPAKIYSDGTVVWQRAGKISAFCSFVGLRRMPFDSLGCQLLFGGTVTQAIDYNLVDVSDGARGVEFPAYNQTYSEYIIAKDKTTSFSLGEDFSIQLYFNRARRHYVNLVIFPTILFVYLSFGQFFYDPTSGERVSFSLNALLIVVAQNIVTSSLLPLCQERIWLNVLTVVCQFFVLAGVFESLFIYSLVKKKINNDTTVVHRDVASDERSRSSVESQLVEKNNHNEMFVAHSDATSVNRIGNSIRLHSQSLRKRLLVIMLLVDSVAIYLFTVSFSLYIIIMYATMNNWDDDVADVWSLDFTYET